MMLLITLYLVVVNKCFSETVDFVVVVVVVVNVDVLTLLVVTHQYVFSCGK